MKKLTKTTRAALALSCTAALALCPTVICAEEVTLFDGIGKATAYIDTDDGLTIYTWGGKPVAYLDDDNVFGFNGRHLGWFADGVVWDHAGYASCALKIRMQSTQFEPFKAFKQFKPFKSFKEFAPLRPIFQNGFGTSLCAVLLSSGGT